MEGSSASSSSSSHAVATQTSSNPSTFSMSLSSLSSPSLPKHPIRASVPNPSQSDEIERTVSLHAVDDSTQELPMASSASEHRTLTSKSITHVMQTATELQLAGEAAGQKDFGGRAGAPGAEPADGKNAILKGQYSQAVSPLAARLPLSRQRSVWAGGKKIPRRAKVMAFRNHHQGAGWFEV
eukprot:GILI01005245.1.p2 GENE.GILI01005245.1~~GILI01005245.1.p2  ORF type:complete len:182 (-),score=42.47 GILI01005245.1:120-665(-)